MPDPRLINVAHEFMEPLSGEYTFVELRRMFDAQREAAGWPNLSDKALARAMKAAGATSFRTSTSRGWVIT
jgi:hypothetical protein